MLWLLGVLLVRSVNCGGGVTASSGVSQFWTDDYKVFENVYGKTSDKELYGASLPASYTFKLNAKDFQNQEATEKKERINYNEDITASGSHLSPGYDVNKIYGAYKKLLANQQPNQEVIQPLKVPVKFMSYGDFKPISQSDDPETYAYLKNLEKQQQSLGFAEPGVHNYKTISGFSPDNSDSYKSIQDILDAHEAKKKKTRPKYPEKERSKYTYGRSKPHVRLVQGNDISKLPPRCSGSSRCSKRIPAPRPSRVRPRPVVRKIKHTIISD